MRVKKDISNEGVGVWGRQNHVEVGVEVTAQFPIPHNSPNLL